jgi:2-dehydropantoate 2-reductase
MSEAATDSRILIWGAGAIGGTVGAYLVRAGRDVLFVDADADHVAAMNAHGLAIEGPIETFTVPAQTLTPEQVTGRFAQVLLCVKAQHTAGAIAAIAPHLAQDGYVVSLQNGLNEREIARVVGAPRTVGAFINFGADYLSPGRILFGGRGAFVLGEIDGRITPRVQALRGELAVFEPNAIVTENIWGFLWGKLGYGALLFATALTNESIADVLADERHRPVLTALAQEVVGVTDALGLSSEGFNGFEPAAFRPGASAAAVAASFEAMAAHNRKSAKSHSGIWRDLAVRKRRTEVDPQIGPIAEEAGKLGRHAPVTRALIRMIHEIEDGRREMAQANLVALAEAAGA